MIESADAHHKHEMKSFTTVPMAPQLIDFTATEELRIVSTWPNAFSQCTNVALGQEKERNPCD